MATKTIYVKENDEKLFDEAAKLKNGISSVIADALREYLAKHSENSDKQTDDKTRLIKIQNDISEMKSQLESINAKLRAEAEEQKPQAKSKRS